MVGSPGSTSGSYNQAQLQGVQVKSENVLIIDNCLALPRAVLVKHNLYAFEVILGTFCW